MDSQSGVKWIVGQHVCIYICVSIRALCKAFNFDHVSALKLKRELHITLHELLRGHAD